MKIIKHEIAAKMTQVTINFVANQPFVVVPYSILLFLSFLTGGQDSMTRAITALFGYILNMDSICLREFLIFAAVIKFSLKRVACVVTTLPHTIRLPKDAHIQRRRE